MKLKNYSEVSTQTRWESFSKIGFDAGNLFEIVQSVFLLEFITTLSLYFIHSKLHEK